MYIRLMNTRIRKDDDDDEIKTKTDIKPTKKCYEKELLTNRFSGEIK